MRLLHNRPITIQLGGGSVTVYDFPSAIVLSRAVFETFLTLHDVFLSPKSDDDFDFTYCLWRIRGIVNLQAFDTISAACASQHSWLMQELKANQDKLQVTDRFKAMKPGHQRSAILKGKDDSEPPRDYISAGFAPEVFKRIYDYTSSYVHADGHAAYQIRSAEHNHEAQRGMFEMALSIAAISISRAILELEQKYPQCKAACDAHPQARLIAGVYADVAMKLGDPKLRALVREHVQEHAES